MKLIIYLLSHDPDAKSNHKRLMDNRSKQPGFIDNQLINIENNKVVIAEADESNLFSTITTDKRREIIVELVAHGLGDNTIRGFSSKDKWSTDIRTPNLIPGIAPEKLKDFFQQYAFADGKYKFNELTLFCCNSYDFGKNLAILMPEIKITCFKEYIRVDKDGNDVRHIDRNGKIIMPIEYDSVTDKMLNYYPAPLRIFEGRSEKHVYAGTDALPDNLRTPNMQRNPDPITIRPNSIHPDHSSAPAPAPAPSSSSSLRHISSPQNTEQTTPSNNANAADEKPASSIGRKHF